MATVDELVIELRAETRKLRRGLDNVNKQLKKTEKTTTKTNSALKRMGGLVGAIGFAALARSTTTTIRKFEDLEATLRAVTGSAAAAAKSFELVRAFTASTVFQVDEVARSFITLKQAGIVPTSEVLQDFGNFAAGMGKSIEQLAQAAFNATTGEMEMLKQFGVVARQQGSTIDVTFNGVTQTIERSGESIVKFLREIGSKEFSTAIAERFNTLSGALANLGDVTDEFQVAIGEGGAKGAMVELTKATTSLIDTMKPLATAIGNAVDQFLGAVTTIVTLVETIALLVQSIANLTIIQVITGLFDGSINTFEEFKETIKGGKSDLDKLDKELQRLVKTNQDFKQAFSADEKREFALFEKLNEDIESARFSMEKLVSDDFADLERIINKAADLQMEVQLSKFVGPLTPEQKETQRNAILNSMLGGLTIEEYKAKVKEFLDESKGLSEGIISMQRAIVSASEQFTSNFVDSLMNGQNALQAFKDFSKKIVSQIITIFLQMEVINRILASIFPNLGLSYGGIVSDAGGGAGAAATRSTGGAGGFVAGGGTVQRGGSYVVGERGPEIFVPNTGGTIMNNMNSKNAMGGTPIVVNQSVNFSTGVVPTVRAEVQKMLPQISDVTKGAVLEAAMRGGQYRKGLLGG